MSGSPWHERGGERVTYHNGYRERNLDTRPGALRACDPEVPLGRLFAFLSRVAPAFGKGFDRCGPACPGRRGPDDYLAAEEI